MSSEDEETPAVPEAEEEEDDAGTGDEPEPAEDEALAEDLDVTQQSYVSPAASATEVKVSPSHDPERLEQLALPNIRALQGTLKLLQSNSSANIARIERLRGVLNSRGGLQVDPEPERLLPPKRRQTKAEEIYERLHQKLRKTAFDALVRRMRTHLPDIILKTTMRRPEDLTAERRALLNTLFVTLVSYVGQPYKEDEHRLYSKVCFALLDYIEMILDDASSSSGDLDTPSDDDTTCHSIPSGVLHRNPQVVAAIHAMRGIVKQWND